jgi:DNA sulfur modification protein DndB
MQVYREPTYTFPAIRGIQAGREYYVAMCPLKLIPKVFIFDEEELRSELRAQRKLNRARIPSIARYLTENADSYIFSALTASLDGAVRFEPVGDEDANYNIGRLVVSMSAQFVINDGQHRRAAIEEALKVRPELGHESIAVVFFVDAGLERSQQMFADLNTHAIRPSLSMGILYDHRDPLAELARELATAVPTFRDRIEFEKTTISNRSVKLFTLSAVYQATRELLHPLGQEGNHRDVPEKAVIEPHIRKLALAYWSKLGEVIPEWRQIRESKVSAAELRAEYVHAHGVALQALGRAGGMLLTDSPKGWQRRLTQVQTVDWRRTNGDLWEGRAMVDGRVQKGHRNVLLTTNVIKRALRVPLLPDEAAAEEEYKDRGVAYSGAPDERDEEDDEHPEEGK